MVANLKGFDVYKPAARDILQWFADNKIHYSQKPRPFGPAKQGVDCSRLIFLAFRGAGAWVRRVRAKDIIAGKGGWDNSHIALADSHDLDLAGMRFGHKEIAHIGALWGD